MIRGFSLLLAVGLLILWLAGLTNHATPWLTWLDGLGALCGFAVAAGASAAAGRATNTAAPIALAVGLGILWIIGLAMHTEIWLTWWTFAFGCAFFIVGIGGGFSDQQQQITRTTPRPV
jgi:hypothetical protein